MNCPFSFIGEAVCIIAKVVKMKIVFIFFCVLGLLFGVEAQVGERQEHEIEAPPYLQAAAWYGVTKQYDKMFSNYIKYKKLWNAFNLVCAGKHAYLFKNYKAADSLILRGIGEYKIIVGENHRLYAFGLGELAFIYQKMGRYNEAIELRQEALNIYILKYGKEHPLCASYANNLANLCESIGDFVKAELLYIKSIQIFKNVYGENHTEYISAYSNLALLYRRMGNYKKAEKMLIDVLETRARKLGEKHYLYGLSLNELAGVYQDLGLYNKTEHLYKKAIAIFKNNANKEFYALLLSNMAVLYEKMGYYNEAKLYLREALAIRKKLPNKIDYAISLNNLALIYKKEQNYEETESLLLLAKDIFERNGNQNHLGYTSVLDNLGSLYKAIKKGKKATFYYREALKIKKNKLGEMHPNYALSLNNLAVFYSAQGNYAKADSIYQVVLDILKNKLGVQHLDYGIVSNNWGSLKFKVGEYKAATEHLINAGLIFQDYINTQYQYLNEERQKLLLQTIYDNLEAFYAFLAKPEIHDSSALYVQNAQLVIKGLSLQNNQKLRQTIALSQDSILRTTYSKWLMKKKQLSEVYLFSSEKQKEQKINIVALAKKVNELEQQLVLKSKVFEWQHSKVHFEDIKHSLKQNAAAIDFVHFRAIHNFMLLDTILYYALVTKKESKYPAYIYIGTEREIQALLDKKINIGQNNYVNDIRMSKQLYHLLWKPLESYLEGVDMIHLSLEGLLSQVAFETLVSNGETEARLLDQYKFRYYGTLKDFVLQSKGIGQVESIQNKEVVLLGGALYDLEKSELEQLGGRYQAEQNRTSGIGHLLDSNKVSSFNYLEGTKKEVEQLTLTFKQAGWKVDTLVGKAALEDKIKALDNKPQILHLATHGFFFPKPRDKERQQAVWLSSGNVFQERIRYHQHPLYRSGLALSGANHTWMGGEPPENTEDGILTAYEVSMLDLYGTELVVLSACETGRGEASNTEGIYGLQRAFKQAGVQKLMVSLWKVPDEQTQELMGHFYQYYLLGKPIHEALEAAKATLQKKYPNPYYWAAFIVVE